MLCNFPTDQSLRTKFGMVTLDIVREIYIKPNFAIVSKDLQCKGYNSKHYIQLTAIYFIHA